MPLLLALFAACAVHRVGIVEVTDAKTRLVSTEGGSERLLLLGEATHLKGLDQHLVEIDGTRTVGRLRVTRFRALEGPHGMPVFTGPVQVLGSQVGVMDTSSGELVLVDDAMADKLRRLAGEWVALEGYIDGPQRIQVVSWKTLD